MGHLGPERVIELCRQHFYWPGYKNDITHYIRKKCKCVIDKKPNKQQNSTPSQHYYTRTIWISNYWLFAPRSVQMGYEYLLIVVDHFSQFFQAFTTKNKSWRAVADLLFNKYFLGFGFPKRILHDQGKEFDN